jgi:hypothetical protein
MSISKEEFLAPRKRKVEPVELPESGGTVYVRKLTVKEQIQLEAECGALDEHDTEGFTAISLAFYLCTEAGEQFITLAEAREHIGSRDATDVAAIMKKGVALNRGLTAKSVEDAKGN